MFLLIILTTFPNEYCYLVQKFLYLNICVLVIASLSSYVLKGYWNRIAAQALKIMYAHILRYKYFIKFFLAVNGIEHLITEKPLSFGSS